MSKCRWRKRGINSNDGKGRLQQEASAGPELLLPCCHWFSEVAVALDGSVALPHLQRPQFDGKRQQLSNTGMFPNDDYEVNDGNT